MKEDDKISENHKMQDHPKSLWQKFKILACPCFKFQLSIQEDNNQFSKADQTNESYIKQKTMQFNDQIRRTKRKNSLQSHEIKQSLIKNSLHLQKSYRESVNLQRQNSLHGQYEIDCSISNFTEDHLISIGIKAKHLLVKISTVKINLSIQLLKKMMRNINRSIQSTDNKQYHNFQFNRFWNQRYILFGKFDQGIKIDQQSWSKILPQKASQYIASKCNGAKKILEGFAGIGGTTIKLADINSISKVIANDHNKKKVEFLLNNLKVYEVDSKVELSNCDFLKIQMKNVDVVVIKPPIRHFIGHRNINITDFDPSLDKIINKSMRLSDNIIMILPPQTNIDVLCSCLNTCASELKKMRNYSSIKIQKIVSQKQIKCILVLIGPLVQTQIKLNEQLQYIYKRLKKGGDGYFKHKKVLKKIRQENGMLNLFNYIKQCESIKRQKTKCNPKQEYHLIDIFYDYIVNRKIICKQKLKKIIQEQNAQFQRQSSYHISLSLHNQEPFDEYNSSVMEEQKMDENSFQLRKQLTQSQCSHYSYNSGNSKKSMQKSIVEQWRSLKGQKSGSIIIKRQEMPMQLYDFSEMKKKITEISQEQSKYNNSYEL